MNSEVRKKTISNEDVLYAANLSRIKIGEDQVSRFQGQLTDILGYIDQLNEVDTSNTQPTSHVISSMKNVFREDVVKRSLPPDEALKNAPDREGDFFRVPRIIQEG